MAEHGAAAVCLRQIFLPHEDRKTADAECILVSVRKNEAQIHKSLSRERRRRARRRMKGVCSIEEVRSARGHIAPAHASTRSKSVYGVFVKLAVWEGNIKPGKLCALQRTTKLNKGRVFLLMLITRGGKALENKDKHKTAARS